MDVGQQEVEADPGLGIEEEGGDLDQIPGVEIGREIVVL